MERIFTAGQQGLCLIDSEQGPGGCPLNSVETFPCCSLSAKELVKLAPSVPDTSGLEEVLSQISSSFRKEM